MKSKIKKQTAWLLTFAMLLTLLSGLTVPALAANSVFDDVEADDWFADAVEYVYDNNLMQGVGSNKFDPDGLVTRAMMWTTLARLDGVNTAGSEPWWLAGQQWAMAEGISDGTMTENDITREQMVTMLYRYAQYLELDVSAGENTVFHSFSDVSAVSDWAVSAMEWACAVGIINGIDGALQPQGSATRAQLAAILYRFVEGIVKAVPTTHTVTFMWNYGSKGVYAETEVEDGQPVGTLPEPSRSGYDFDGWYTTDGVLITPDTKVTEDVVVYAEWTKEVYIPPIHFHVWIAGTPVPPTCTEQGYTPYTCFCGSTKNDDFVDAQDHNWSDWTSEDDSHSRVCLNDESHVESGSCDLIYVCNDDGTHDQKCSVCEYVKTNDSPCAYDASGNCVCGHTADVVAAVGNVGFAKLEDAVNAAENNDTVVLLSDVDNQGVALIIPEGKRLTLDLNGYTFTSVSGGNDNFWAILVKENASLVLTDSKDTGKIVSSCYGVFVNPGASFELQGGTLQVNEHQVTSYQMSYAVALNGGTFKMTGGAITARDCVIVANGSQNNVVDIADGTVTLNGDDSQIFTLWGTGTYSVSGGTFEGNFSIITMGEMEEGGSKSTVDPGKCITGGVFDVDPDDYVADGYKAVKGDDEKWRIEDTGYTADASGNWSIRSAAGLQALADAVNGGNNFSGKTITLTANIDLTGVEWTPIGTNTKSFQGTFDGGNHTVSNLKNITGQDYLGFFGYIGQNAVIQNLNIHNVTFTGGAYVGSVCGYDGSSKTITRCKVTGTIQIIGNYCVGGIAGLAYSWIGDCSVIADAGTDSYVKGVYLKENREGDNVGGIVGQHGEYITYSLCVASINVEGTRKVGGVVGYLGPKGTLSQCEFTGTVSCNASDEYAADNSAKLFIGGIVGESGGTSSKQANITDCTVHSGSVIRGKVEARTGAILGGSRNSGEHTVVTDCVSDGVTVGVIQ